MPRQSSPIPVDCQIPLHIRFRCDAVRTQNAYDAPDKIDGFIAGKMHYGIFRFNECNPSS